MWHVWSLRDCLNLFGHSAHPTVQFQWTPVTQLINLDQVGFQNPRSLLGSHQSKARTSSQPMCEQDCVAALPPARPTSPAGRVGWRYLVFFVGGSAGAAPGLTASPWVVERLHRRAGRKQRGRACRRRLFGGAIECHVDAPQASANRVTELTFLLRQCTERGAVSATR